MSSYKVSYFLYWTQLPKSYTGTCTCRNPTRNIQLYLRAQRLEEKLLSLGNSRAVRSFIRNNTGLGLAPIARYQTPDLTRNCRSY
eukprot:COSAG05_NODE_205_length_14184_cov_81.700887_7_plen_85_part_00